MERVFKEGELVLANASVRTDIEKWVPAIYVRQWPTGSHEVKAMDGDSMSSMMVGEGDVRHADEAYPLKVHYEVYADTDGSYASQYCSLESAKRAAEEGADGPYAVVVDKVLVGGCGRVFVAYPKA